jgi:hypothetical protein
MSYNLVLNSSNVVNKISNNIFQYNFNNQGFKINEGSNICIGSLTIPYSWYNITTNYNNKMFQIIFPNTSLVTYTIALPDGFYSIDDINNYIQQVCIQNNLYLIDAYGNYVYYLSFSYNVSTYSIQLLTYVVPTSLPSGWSQPTSWAGYPATTKSPAFVVLPNNFGQIIGFNAGTFGGASSNQSILSTFTPIGSPVNNLIIRCNLVDNSCANPSDILDCMPITSSFGSNINYSPNFEKWVKLKTGTFNNLQITLSDQNFETVYCEDSNILISLLIK